jgi:glycine dehydrogenase subunit 1
MYYIPHTKKDIETMKKSLNITSIDELFKDIPDTIFNPKLNLENSIDEISLLSEISNIAEKNKHRNISSFLGAGAYNHYIPAVVKEITQRNEFYTAYTPYQPEMSQGILQAIFEFQTMICELTGLDVSNASLYDGSTAIWEAILMSVRITKKNKIIICEPINPNYKKLINTYAKYAGIEISYIKDTNYKINITDLEKNICNSTASIICQYPNFLGIAEDLTEIGKLAEQNNSLFICSVNPIALGLFETPATMGADIIIGEGQPLGMPLSFGGPYLGFISAKQKFLRQMPGRIVGQTKDEDKKTGYVLTMQTREQHIRREKATSNICSNQALMALAASVYLSYMGPIGLNKIAQICFDKCATLKKQLNKFKNIKLNTDTINFNEFVIELSEKADNFIEKAEKQNILPGFNLKKYNNSLENHILICVTEKTTDKDIEKFVSFLQKQESRN